MMMTISSSQALFVLSTMLFGCVLAHLHIWAGNRGVACLGGSQATFATRHIGNHLSSMGTRCYVGGSGWFPAVPGTGGVVWWSPVVPEVPTPLGGNRNWEPLHVTREMEIRTGTGDVEKGEMMASSKREIDPKLRDRIREMVREAGFMKPVARQLRVKARWVEDGYSGFATPLAEMTLKAAVGMRGR